MGTSFSPQSRIVVQTHATLAETLNQQAPTLLVLLGFSALLGILSGVVSLQRLLHLGSLDARIGALLDLAHLRACTSPSWTSTPARPWAARCSCASRTAARR